MDTRFDDNELSDAEMVEAWKTNKDETSLNALVSKYYPLVFRRLKYKMSSVSTAEDITQNSFIKLIMSLDNYTEQGKFANFLSTIVSGQIIEHYRIDGKHSLDDEFNADFHIDDKSTQNDLADNLSTSREVEYLVTHCIPRLPVQERLVFLLMHESEFWDFESPLDWTHLAVLNGINKETAWGRFESARKMLMTGTSVDQIDNDELLIFLVWTEAKRPFKTNHTLQYYASLLGEAEQNLRNRSHKAKKRLDECLSNYRQT